MTETTQPINTNLKEFIDKFLKPPKGDSPEQIAARIRYWVDIANRPEVFCNGDTSSHAVSAKRRSALQNLRRLLKRHPEVAESMLRESEAMQ